MVGALGEDDGLAPRVSARRHQGQRRRVAAIFAKQRPLSMAHHGGHGLGELDHERGGAGHCITKIKLAAEGGIDAFVAIAQ